jgi:hypothetical protein
MIPQPQARQKHPAIALAISGSVMLLMTGCSNATPNVALSNVTAAPSSAPAKKSVAATQISAPVGKVNCSTVMLANSDLGSALAKMVNFTADTDYTAFTRPDSPFYMDMKKIHGAIDTLATLPDPTDAVELAFGKPSQSIDYFRQMVTVAEGDIQSKGKPFKDTNTAGQKVLGLDSPWMKEYTPFGPAIEKACPGASMPTDVPTSNTAAYTDKVATIPGVAGYLPVAGNRFVIIYATVENTGKDDLSLNAIALSTLKDTKGTVFGLDPYAALLESAKLSGATDGNVIAGGKRSTGVGFQAPVGAGDLVWIVSDNAGHRAVIAIKADQITVVGAVITQGTADAMQASVAATRDAIIALGNSADATAAAASPMPQGAVVTDTPEPTDAPVPTDTPEPTTAP